MNEASLRTEDLTTEEINNLFVMSDTDQENISALKSNQPLLLIGSRGTGKTMLMRKAELELDSDFSSQRILSVHVSFIATIIYSDSTIDPIHLMLNKIAIALRGKLKQHGILINGNLFSSVVSTTEDPVARRLDEFILRTSGAITDQNSTENEKMEAVDIDDTSIIKDVDLFKDFVVQLCIKFEIKKIILLFDEACQIFSPSQQRVFFDLFRSLRSPYIVCKAAVYPGLVSYGTFQPFHDATIATIERNILSTDYLETMREIVLKNYPESKEKLLTNVDLLNTIILCASGNPRFLLKSLNSLLNTQKGFSTKNATHMIKEFYRATIWAEHSKLDERYKGHMPLITWVRNFVEDTVVPDINQINVKSEDNQSKTTLFFAISREAPEAIKQSIKILEYSGIAILEQEATRFRKDVYDRYQLNYGIVLLSFSSSNLTEASEKLYKNISLKRFQDYGRNSRHYQNLPTINLAEDYFNQQGIIEQILKKELKELELSQKLLDRLSQEKIFYVEDIFKGHESDLEKIDYIGPIRSRKIYNQVMSAIIEYISG